MYNIEDILELNELIKEHLSQLKRTENEENKEELLKNLDFLKECWKKESDFDYPMIPNKNKKPVDIKTVIKENGWDKKYTYKAPTLDSVIDRTTNDTNLVNSIYSKNNNTDVPNPYRKRKK